ncbi:MAG: Fic family protein [Acidobacteriota bacterium]|nr:Fic family protein [Acidobacteriota bacterium]MDH3783782.1 Fic family protein [Acidobacteriota bacterium]
MIFKIPNTPKLRQTLTEIDRVRDRFRGGRPAPSSRLERMAYESLVRGSASACRLAAIPMTDQRAGEILEAAPGDADERELACYAAGLRSPVPSRDRLLDSSYFGALHSTLTGNDPTRPSPWRDGPLHNEAFDQAGHATGRVIPTLPSHLVETKMEDLLTWLELELRSGDHHPIMVVATFTLGFLGISPFGSKNHRLGRLLLQKLLMRAGYEHLRYASLEVEIERSRDAYYSAIDRSRSRLWIGAGQLEPWIEFVTDCLDGQRRWVEAQLGESSADPVPTQREISPLQEAILLATRDHGVVDAGLLIEKTGANRNTLKDNLRKLVDLGYLERSGQRRGTRYRIAELDDPPVPEV